MNGFGQQIDQMGLMPSTQRVQPIQLDPSQGQQGVDALMMLGELLMQGQESPLPPDSIMRPADTIPMDNGGYGAVSQNQPQNPMDAGLLNTLNQTFRGY